MWSISNYETADGRRYRVHYRDPKRRNHEKAGFVRKRDAEEYLASVLIASARGEYIDPAQGRASIHELGVEWLRNQGHLKPSSFHPVEIAWRVHIDPVWGDRRVGELLHSNIQNWLTQWGKDRSPTTVLRAYGVLAGILDVAVRDRRISLNPAREVDLLRKTRSKDKYLTI